MLLACSLMNTASLTGSLIQIPMSEKGKITRGRLGSLSLKKEGERQCFLFSKHLIICTRGSGGKLYITKVQQGCIIKGFICIYLQNTVKVLV